MAIGISSDFPVEEIRFDPRYRGFVVEREPEVWLEACYQELPDLPDTADKKVFDTGTVWSLYEHGQDHIFVLHTPEGEPYRIVRLSPGFRRGQVFIRQNEEAPPGMDPLQFPLGEVLMVCWLAEFGGMMVHACGVDDEGRGYLFAGNSTHGKSTMAGLWQGQATILSDDRIVIRRRGDRFWMYGTPWHGDFRGFSSHGVLLEKVFFLEHGQENRARPEPSGVGLAKLVARLFAPLWNARQMQNVVEFAGDVVEHLIPHTLAFVPDKKVVSFVRAV